MRLCVLGATGRTGAYLTQLALADGHEVQALVRQADKLPQQDRLQLIVGDATNEEQLAKAMRGCDAVISALGTDGGHVLSLSTPLMIKTMKQEGVTRLITIGTAGILQARSNPALYRFQSGESRRRTTAAAEEHLQVYQLLQKSNLRWTIVCPTHLVDGEATGVYRVEKELLPEDGLKITVGDTALFAYRQLFSAEYERARAGIAY